LVGAFGRWCWRRARLTEIGIRRAARRYQFRIYLRQRRRRTTGLGPALHKRAHAIDLDAEAHSRGAALKAGLLASGDDLRARPLARYLRSGEVSADERQCHDRRDLQSVWPPRRCVGIPPLLNDFVSTQQE
jgi:hypothetical protein